MPFRKALLTGLAALGTTYQSDLVKRSYCDTGTPTPSASYFNRSSLTQKLFLPQYQAVKTPVYQSAWKWYGQNKENLVSQKPTPSLKDIKGLFHDPWKEYEEKYTKENMQSLLTFIINHPEQLGELTREFENIASPSKNHLIFEDQIAHILSHSPPDNWLMEKIYRESPSSKLRDVALSYFLSKLSIEPKPWLLENILEHANNISLPPQELFARIAQIITQNKELSDAAIQTLIMQGLKSSETRNQALELLINYFKLTNDKTSLIDKLDHKIDPINAAFARALEDNTLSIPELQQVVIATNKNRFEQFIYDQKLLAKANFLLITDETVPLKLRADLLQREFNKGDLYTVRKMIKKITDDPFKEYAHTIIRALYTDPTSHEHLQARAKLAQIAGQDPDALTAYPSILNRKLGGFDLQYYDNSDQNPIYKLVNSFLTGVGERHFPQFDDDKYFFAFSSNPYGTEHRPKAPRLWAHDAQTGYPLWIYQETPDNSLPKRYDFTFSPDRVYYVDDHNIVALDKTNGEIQHKFTILGHELPLYKAYATQDNKVYITYQRGHYEDPSALDILDATTGKSVTVDLPNRADATRATFTNNMLIVPNRTDFIIVDSTGNKKIIPHHNEDKIGFGPVMHVTPNIWLYQRIFDKNRMIVALDPHTHKELFTHPLEDDLEAVVADQKTGNVFVLSKKSALAFNKNNELLWEKTLPHSFFDTLHLTKDGTKLYAYSSSEHTLYTLDQNTGAITQKTKMEYSRSTHILGEHNGKLLIGGYSY